MRETSEPTGAVMRRRAIGIVAVCLLITNAGCESRKPDGVLDREYFETHRIAWEALVAKYLESRKPDDLAPVKHGQIGDRFAGLTIYGDCLLFEMKSDSLSARRAIVYKF